MTDEEPAAGAPLAPESAEPPDATPPPTERDRPADLDPAVILPRVLVHPLPPQASADALAAGPPGPEREVDGPSEKEKEKLHNQGLQQFYGMRLIWSRWLIGWVSCLIAFQILLAVAIGSGALDFRGYDTFLGLTVGQNFAQIVALALIVVRFLHSRSESDDPPP